MWIGKKRVEALEATVEALAKRVYALEMHENEVKPRTVEDIVNDAHEPITTARILDEWLNGKEDGDGSR